MATAQRKYNHAPEIAALGATVLICVVVFAVLMSWAHKRESKMPRLTDSQAAEMMCETYHNLICAVDAGGAVKIVGKRK